MRLRPAQVEGVCPGSTDQIFKAGEIQRIRAGVLISTIDAPTGGEIRPGQGIAIQGRSRQNVDIGKTARQRGFGTSKAIRTPQAGQREVAQRAIIQEAQRIQTALTIQHTRQRRTGLEGEIVSSGSGIQIDIRRAADCKAIGIRSCVDRVDLREVQAVGTLISRCRRLNIES